MSLTVRFLLIVSLMGTALVAHGADLSVKEEAAFRGRFGLRVSQGTGASVLVDDTPDQLSRLFVQFYVLADHLHIPVGEHVQIFVAEDGFANQQVALALRGGASTDLIATLRLDDGSTIQSTPMSLSPGWRRIALTWRAGDGNGGLEVNLDEQIVTLADQDNPTARLETLFLGLSGNPPPGLSGALDIDEYEARRAGELDPVCFTPPELNGVYLDWPTYHSVLYLVSIRQNACVTRE